MPSLNGMHDKPAKSITEIIDEKMIDPDVIDEMSLDDAKTVLLEHMDQDSINKGIDELRIWLVDRSQEDKKKEAIETPHDFTLKTEYSKVKAEATNAIEVLTKI